MFITNKILGTLLLVTSTLIIWNWGIMIIPSETILVVVTALFIIIPIFYMVNCSCAGEKNASRKKIDPFILSALLLIAAATIYQLFIGKFGTTDFVWDYVNGFSVILYSCLAGRLIR